VSNSGQTGTASLDAGNALVFKPEITFTAPATNTQPIEVVGSGGTVVAVDPGETVIAITGVVRSGGMLLFGGTAAADVVRVSGGITRGITSPSVMPSTNRSAAVICRTWIPTVAA
jgi:hypothetical protein